MRCITGTGVIVLLGLLSAWATAFNPVAAASFTPPSDNSAPSQGSGGAARGGFQFLPPEDNATPRSGTSGAARSSFIPPADNAVPQQTGGGAARGERGFIPSPDNARPLSSVSGAARADGYGGNSDVFTGLAQAMLPVTPSSFYGLTLSERPLIMAYVPASSAQQAIFRLKNESQAVIYEQIVPLSGETGILAIQLPDEAPVLQVGEYYQWFVTLQTDDYLTPSSPFVDAWIKRIEPTEAIAQAMESDDAIAQAETLAQEGIWYDAAAVLAVIQDQQTVAPELSSVHWNELLSSVGLDTLIETPLLFATTNY